MLGYLEKVEDVFDEPDRGPPALFAFQASEEAFSAAQAMMGELGIDLSKAELEIEQKDRLALFLAANRDIFAADMDELGTTHLCEHKIDTGDSAPISQRPYRVCPEKKKEIERQVDDMLKNGVIEPSLSRWISPVVLVKKKDKTYRFAVDYRKLNAVTKPQNFPLPRLDDALDVLKDGVIFSVMHLRSGFWQVKLHDETKEKSAFICHKGVYQFRKLPFGLRNAPVQFQYVMECAFHDINFRYVLIYVDDVLCFSPDFDTHLQHLDGVFSTFSALRRRFSAPASRRTEAETLQPCV